LGRFSVILIRELYPGRALKNQIEEKPEKKPYVKADLTHHLNMTLEIVSEKLGISKSAVVCNALGYYFKNEFREAFPKSEAELRLDAQEQEDLKRYAQEYINKSYTVQSIPHMEDHIEGTKNDMITHETKFNKIVEKIKKIDPKNKIELKKLQSEKSDQEKNLKHLKKILEDQKRELEDQKKRITDRTL